MRTESNYYQYCLLFLSNSEETKLRIKEILQGGNDNRNNLIAKVLRNNKLLEVQSLLLCVVIQTHESIEAFENYLKEQFDSDDQLLEEATRIKKKCLTLKKDGFFGAKILSMCPTHLHWMALFNDVKTVEVKIKALDWPLAVVCRIVRRLLILVHKWP